MKSRKQLLSWWDVHYYLAFREGIRTGWQRFAKTGLITSPPPNNALQANHPKIYHIYMCVLKDSQKNMGPIFADPKNNWNKPTPRRMVNTTAPWSRWRLPTTSLVKKKNRFSNGEHFGHHIYRPVGRCISRYIYIYIFTYHIYIYCNIVYIICIYVLILIIR